jgi:hypothetical protein
VLRRLVVLLGEEKDTCRESEEGNHDDAFHPKSDAGDGSGVDEIRTNG